MNSRHNTKHNHSPFVNESLDVEPKRGADGHYVFIIETFENSGLPSVIESTKRIQDISGCGWGDLSDSQKEDADFPFLPSILANNRKETHIVDVLVDGTKEKRSQKLKESARKRELRNLSRSLRRLN